MKEISDVHDRCGSAADATWTLGRSEVRHVRHFLVRSRLYPVQYYTARHQQTQGKVPYTVATSRPTASIHFCRAMRCISATYAVMRCLSVCVSVRHVRELRQNE